MGSCRSSSSTGILSTSGLAEQKSHLSSARAARTSSLNNRNTNGTPISIMWKMGALNRLRMQVKKNVPSATQGYSESLASMKACSRPPYRTYGCNVSRSLKSATIHMASWNRPAKKMMTQLICTASSSLREPLGNSLVSWYASGRPPTKARENVLKRPMRRVAFVTCRKREW